MTSAKTITAITTAPSACRPSAPRNARDLSASLLAAPTATEGLHRWCVAHELGAGPILAVKVAGPVAPPEEAVLDWLRPHGDEAPPVHRRVALCRSGLVLARADNWFMPERLPRALRAALARTDVPFGALVRPLGVRRQTVLVRFLDEWADGGGAWETGAPPTVLEHAAVLFDRHDRLLCGVHERFTAALL